jgi:hypothetical protein
MLDNIQQFHELHQAAFAEGRYADLPLSCAFPVDVDFAGLNKRKIDTQYEGFFGDLFTTDCESKIAPELTPLSQHLLGGMLAAGRKVHDRYFIFDFSNKYVKSMQPAGWHVDCIPLYVAEDYTQEHSQEWLHRGVECFQTVVSEKFPTAVAPEDTFAGRPEGFDHRLYILAMLNAVMGRDVFIPWQEVAREIGGSFNETKLNRLIDSMKLRGDEIVARGFVTATPTPGRSTATHFHYLAPHAPTQCPVPFANSPLPGLHLHNQILLRSFPDEPK